MYNNNNNTINKSPCNSNVIFSLRADHLIPGGGGALWFFVKKVCSAKNERNIDCSANFLKKIVCS